MKVPLSVVVLFVLGLLVIFKPSVFYLDQSFTDRADESLGLVTADATRWTALRADLAAVEAELDETTAQVASLKKQVPWVGSAPPAVARDLQRASTALERLHYEQASLQRYHEDLMHDTRAVVSVFSRESFDEARELFKTRQKAHAQTSKEVWKWDMILGALFGNNRDDDVGSMLIKAALQLLWRLTMGSVIAFFDFAIRLPFYLREYDLHDIRFEELETDLLAAPPIKMPKQQDHHHDSHQTASRQMNRHMNDELMASVPDAVKYRQERPASANGWFSRRTLKLLTSWIILVSGAGLTTLVFSLGPWIVLGGVLYAFSLANNNGSRSRFNQHHVHQE